MQSKPSPQHGAVHDAAVHEAMNYRRALGGFATGVCVVTADTREGPLGITVNSFTSVSLEPRLILWCLDERSNRWRPFAGAERFSLHVLGADDRDVAARFARGVCGLEEGEFTLGETGGPRLDVGVTRLDCRTHSRVPLGDHMAVVGEVESFESREGPALTFWRGHFGMIGGEA